MRLIKVLYKRFYTPFERRSEAKCERVHSPLTHSQDTEK